MHGLNKRETDLELVKFVRNLNNRLRIVRDLGEYLYGGGLDCMLGEREIYIHPEEHQYPHHLYEEEYHEKVPEEEYDPRREEEERIMHEKELLHEEELRREEALRREEELRLEEIRREKEAEEPLHEEGGPPHEPPREFLEHTHPYAPGWYKCRMGMTHLTSVDLQFHLWNKCIEEMSGAYMSHPKAIDAGALGHFKCPEVSCYYDAAQEGWVRSDMLPIHEAENILTTCFFVFHQSHASVAFRIRVFLDYHLLIMEVRNIETLHWHHAHQPFDFFQYHGDHFGIHF